MLLLRTSYALCPGVVVKRQGIFPSDINCVWSVSDIDPADALIVRVEHNRIKICIFYSKYGDLSLGSNLD